MAGSGPAIVLVHGIASNSAIWDRVMPSLAEHATVIAPDLIGHGGSPKGGGDYSLGALANGVRDLMVALGQPRATLIGHSLGGGVAMQFAFQFPERCERMVLVDSGGLGREVGLMLRLLSLPGLEFVLPPVFAPRVRSAGSAMIGAVRRVGIRPGASFDEIWSMYDRLGDRDTRHAFFHTLRSVVDLAGQRPNALDRLYLMERVPTLIVWGERDSIIPVKHAYEAQRALPGSRLEIFERIGHMPQVDSPERFVQVVLDFLRTAPTPAGSGAAPASS